MLKDINFKKILMILLVGIVIFTAIISFQGSKSTSYAKTSEMDNEDILEFLKEGYNAYWYLDSLVDKDNIVIIDNKDYVKVTKDFYSKNDINKYFNKFYSKKATSNIMKNLMPKFAEGSLYILAGEAGDRPNIEQSEIVDNNMKNGYITLKIKDNNTNEDMYLRAYIVLENEKIKIDSWKVL